MNALHPPLLAAIEGFLFFVVLIVISAFSNWIKQQQQKREGGAPGKPAAPRRPLLDEATDWEAELRRLLEGDQPEPPSPPPARPAAPPPLSAERPPAPSLAPTPPAEWSPLPPAPPRSRATDEQVRQLDEAVMANERELRTELARLEVSREAYERASQLDRSVKERLQKISDLPRRARADLRAASGGRKAGTTRRLRAVLRRPASAREAIVLAEILGPPKGLQNSPR